MLAIEADIYEEWSTFDYLEHVFPGQAVLGVEQVARALGYDKKTVYNRISRGDFPIANVGGPGRPAFRKLDIARHVDRNGGPHQVKTRRGRRRVAGAGAT